MSDVLPIIVFFILGLIGGMLLIIQVENRRLLKDLTKDQSQVCPVTEVECDRGCVRICRNDATSKVPPIRSQSGKDKT